MAIDWLSCVGQRFCSDDLHPTGFRLTHYEMPIVDASWWALERAKGAAAAFDCIQVLSEHQLQMQNESMEQSKLWSLLHSSKATNLQICISTVGSKYNKHFSADTIDGLNAGQKDVNGRHLAEILVTMVTLTDMD